ncbi:MAG: CGNR zinc finger domain-containing protein [Micrococcales bacterium]|nr:CGNR zinc finger domain-containing protein [Micrococcales bacterium]
MVFAHDTQVSLQTMAALVNTAGEPDALSGVADLDEFVRTWSFTGRHDGDEAELTQVRRLRGRLRDYFDLPDDKLVEAVNGLLRGGRALPQVVRHDEWGWHLHAIGPEQPLATRMAVEAAMALVDVLRAQETDRLRTCDAPDCDRVLVDLSRNRSRRFCGTNCGNRVAAAAYRSRLAGR